MSPGLFAYLSDDTNGLELEPLAHASHARPAHAYVHDTLPVLATDGHATRTSPSRVAMGHGAGALEDLVRPVVAFRRDRS